ncbi:hypothetical protein BSKO_04952 [Bryopsis sp. KO-2023]|nr:hypothetical protein BSKO_04952 [Bryopsis sp. KO-2023]
MSYARAYAQRAKSPSQGSNSALAPSLPTHHEVLGIATPPGAATCPKPPAPTAQSAVGIEARTEFQTEKASRDPASAPAGGNTGMASCREKMGCTKPPPKAPSWVTKPSLGSRQSAKRTGKKERVKTVGLAKLLRTMPHLFEKEKISVVDKGVTHLTQLPERYHKVKVMYISKNKLRSLKGIEQFPELRMLSVAYNPLDDLDVFGFLSGATPALENASFFGCPVSGLTNYRAHAIAKVPSLQKLDGKLIDEEDRAAATKVLEKEQMTMSLMVHNACLVHKLGFLGQLIRMHTELRRLICRQHGPFSQIPPASSVHIPKLMKMWDYESTVGAQGRRLIRNALHREVARMQTPESKSSKGVISLENFDQAAARVMAAQQQAITNLIQRIHEAQEDAKLVALEMGSGLISSMRRRQEEKDQELAHDREELIASLRDSLEGLKDSLHQVRDEHCAETGRKKEHQQKTTTCSKRSGVRREPQKKSSDGQLKEIAGETYLLPHRPATVATATVLDRSRNVKPRPHTSAGDRQLPETVKGVAGYCIKDVAQAAALGRFRHVVGGNQVSPVGARNNCDAPDIVVERDKMMASGMTYPGQGAQPPAHPLPSETAGTLDQRAMQYGCVLNDQHGQWEMHLQSPDRSPMWANEHCNVQGVPLPESPGVLFPIPQAAERIIYYNQGDADEGTPHIEPVALAPHDVWTSPTLQPPPNPSGIRPTDAAYLRTPPFNGDIPQTRQHEMRACTHRQVGSFGGVVHRDNRLDSMNLLGAGHNPQYDTSMAPQQMRPVHGNLGEQVSSVPPRDGVCNIYPSSPPGPAPLQPFHSSHCRHATSTSQEQECAHHENPRHQNIKEQATKKYRPPPKEESDNSDFVGTCGEEVPPSKQSPHRDRNIQDVQQKRTLPGKPVRRCGRQGRADDSYDGEETARSFPVDLYFDSLRARGNHSPYQAGQPQVGVFLCLPPIALQCCHERRRARVRIEVRVYSFTIGLVCFVITQRTSSVNRPPHGYDAAANVESLEGNKLQKARLEVKLLQVKKA